MISLLVFQVYDIKGVIMYGKYSHLFDEKNIVLKIKEFKKEVNFLQSRNKNRLLSSEIANLYHRLSLAKNIMDNIIINDYLPTIKDEKGIIDRINLYNRYIFDNDLTDDEFHKVKKPNKKPPSGGFILL